MNKKRPKDNNSYTLYDLLQLINKRYLSIFGRTPLKQRLDDILKETLELTRYTDLRSMREEAGDLLTSLLQLLNECDWDPNELIIENLKKITRRSDQYRSLGRKTQVAILGGAFDPIHEGHIQAAKLVLNNSGTFDEVWIMPCYAHIYNKKMMSAEHRLNMCKIAAQKDGRLIVSDYEIKNRFKGETYNLAKRLLEDKTYNSSHSFSFVIGLDNANTFSDWVNYLELERLIRFVVVPRSGETRKRGVNWFLKSPHIFIESDSPIIEMSSTYIREILAEKYKNSKDLFSSIKGLDEGVKNYIFEQGLYK